MPSLEERLLAYDVTIAASPENQWEDVERGMVTPKPELTRLRALRGVVRLEAGKHADALEDFTFVLMQVPDDVTALTNRGVAYRALGLLERAIEDYTRATHAAARLAQCVPESRERVPGASANS